MHFSILLVLQLSVFFCFGFDIGEANIITRDVAIIGGGSTGTYAAMRFLDEGHSVVVVEAKGRLGGHTETYHDPATGGTIELGVIIFHDLDIVKNYFKRFNISLKSNLLQGNNTTTYVDLGTGKLVTGFIPPTPLEFGAALKTYGSILSKYSYVQEGFELPYPVPEDLTIPFGEFLDKYKLQTLAYTIFTIFQGLGDILDIPTIYVMQYFGLDALRSLQTGFLTTAKNDNSQLYEKATAELLARKSVLLNTRVAHAERDQKDSDGYFTLSVHTGDSLQYKIIRAKKILITIPPTPENLTPFELNPTEKAIFSKFKWNSYLSGVLKNTGLNANTSYSNVDPERKYGIPKLPTAYSIYQSPVPGLFQVQYVATSYTNETAVKKDIMESLARLESSGVIPAKKQAAPEFVVLTNHVPFAMKVDRKDLEAGLYMGMNWLQGKRGTWWTGAAWLTQDSSLLWNFTENIVQRMLKDVEGGVRGF